MLRFIKWIIILSVISFLAYLTYMRFFVPHGSGGMMGMGGMSAPPVSIAEVIQRDVQQWKEFSGRIVAVDSAEIRPQVSGLIEKVHFTEGEKVKKGQLLFTIDQRPYRAALSAAQAQNTLAQAEIERAEILLSENAIPQREYDQRKNAADVAKANLTRAQLDYDYTLVKAPVAGRVGRAEITVGNLVSTGSNAPVLTTVVSDDPVYADFDVDEQALLKFMSAVGGDAEQLKSIPVYLGLSGEEGAPHAGLVQSFDNQVNTSTGTIRVRTIFDNENGKLIPGLFARIRLGSPDSGRAILITDRAIGTDQNKKFVLLLGTEDKVEYREVKPGAIAEGLRIIESGLSPGDKIVVNGVQRARPGMQVKPEFVSMDAADAAANQMPDKNAAP